MNLNDKNIKKNPFKTPDNYFEKFEEELLDDLYLDHTTDSSVKSGHKVPEGYFDSLEDKILEKVKLQEKEPKVISIFSRKRVLISISIAASIVLGVTLFSKFSESTLDFDSVELSEIETYIENETLDIDTYDLTAILVDGDMALNNLDVNDYLSEENIEEYLINNSTDTELLINYE